MKSSGTKTVEFSLPDIPVVSQFSDIFTDTTLDMKTTRQLKDKKLPRPVSCTSSIFEDNPSHYHEITSIPPSILSEKQHYSKKYDTIAPPLVFSDYPPAIFDLLTSDEDERIIIWGLDPQVLSASMATTSAAGKKLSLDETPTPTPSTLTTPSLASVQSVPTNPTIKGFSSNTTTGTTSTSESTPSTAKRLMKPRWSSQFLSEKLSKTSLPLIKNKHHLPRYGTPTPDPFDDHYKEKSGSILFKFARKQSMRVGKGKRVNAIMEDDQRSVQSVDVPKVIEAATVEKLVEKLTMSLDYTLMTDFFLTYRTFISPAQLCKLLILRFRWGLESDQEERCIVRIRTFVVMRHWLLNYFVHDFIPSRELRITLTSFLNALPFHPRVKQSPRDQRIVKSLKRVVRRLKKVYYLRSAESDRVKVIAPPPPTEEQERVEEMVRAKLAQSPIRRKTAIVSSVNISDRHHGNRAVQDTGSAPVVVIGSVRNTSKVPPNASSSMDIISRTPTPLHTMHDGSSIHQYQPESQQPQPVRRNISTASISKFGKNNKQHDIEAVKASYMRRMEQQKRAMEMQQNDTSTLPMGPAGDNMSYQSSVMTDDSLESALSPGTTDVEMSDDEDEEDEDDDEEYSDEDETHENKQRPTEEQLTIRLERERRKREEEEEQNRAAFFSPSSPISLGSSSLVKVPTSSSIQSGSDVIHKTGSSSEDVITGDLSIAHNEKQHPRLPLEEAASVTARARQNTQNKNQENGLTTKQSTKESWKISVSSQYQPQPEQQQNQSTRSARRILTPSHIHPTEQIKSHQGQQQTTVGHVAQQLRGQDGSQMGDSLPDGDNTTLSSDNNRPSSPLRRSSQHHPRQKGHGGPVYLSQLARRSITSGGINGEEDEDQVLHIQEANTGTTITSNTEEEEEEGENSTRRAHMSITSSELGIHGTAIPQSPKSPKQHMIELDLPKPQQSTTPIPPSITPSGSRRTSSLYPQKSFILAYRSERMARQLCLLEAQVLLNIDWEEMVHCRWTKMANTDALDDMSEFTEEDEDDMIERDVNFTRRTRQIRLARGENRGGIEQVIKRFNDVCQWVASEIVHTRSLEERAKVVEKFIRLAQKCKLYCNFATLVQILLGLQSPAVSRLKKTWSRVGAHEMRILDQLSEFTSPMKNWKHIRDSMTQVAEEYGMSPVEVQIEMPGTNHHAFTKTKIKIPFGGCIPFLGIYLSDLVFNSEQPPYIQPTHDHHRIYQANNRTASMFTSPLLKQPLVNFRKHRITATVIKRVLTFQSLARRYSFERDDEVYFLCAELRASNADQVRKLSHEIEP
ncbi:ras guanine nucleotide exchange factor domain-containing protein [Circinella umbellata]|nr:ras guanine nucleotide exchange factor domain-containing protein [Circinella umbellata]